MKSFKQHLHESTLATVFEMKDEQFDALLDRLDDKELNELEEGIVGAIAKGVKKVGSAAVSGVKKVAKRMSTAGRAEAAQAKLAKIRQKKADRERLAKAKADIAKERQPAKPAAPKPASPPKPAAPKKPVTASYHNKEEVKYPHMMYDPKTGKEVEAKDKADHDKYTKMGYTHDKPEMKEHRNIVDTITDVLSEDGHSQNPTGDGTDLSLNDVKNIADGLSLQIEYETLKTGCTKIYAKIV